MHILLVGLGNMGNKYFWKLEEIGERLVLCDVDPSKEKRPYPFYCHFGEVEEKLKAVIVAVDPQYHTEIAREFLERGISVLLEKPPALSSEEFKAIKDYKTLYVSEVESYSLCVDYLRSPKKYLRIERFGRGKGYISPLWDLAWHDLYLLQRLSKSVLVKDLRREDSLWTLEGLLDDVPFTLCVAWEHPQPRRYWYIDDHLLLDFGGERVYVEGKLIKEEKRDKLGLMVRDFLIGNFDKGSVERAYINLKILEDIA
ncbi:MAG: Gfo/Idh/MocA family oxidoreductase [Aquificaceae bacterium]